MSLYVPIVVTPPPRALTFLGVIHLWRPPLA